MDACTGSAPYYKPLRNELIDAFTAKVDVAPRATFSSFSGKMSHTAQSRTVVDESVEDSAQDENEEQTSQNNSRSTKQGYNNNITLNNNVTCIS